MVRTSSLADALTCLKHAEKSGMKQVVLRPASKLIIAFLKVMQEDGYIGKITYVDTKRQGKIIVELIGRINKCAVVTPRYDVKLPSIEKWVSTLLPSRQFGSIVLSTSQGIMNHELCREKEIGGKILGYFF